MAPVMVGMTPFAFLLGLTAAGTNWTWWMVGIQSIAYIAGAAQLAAVQLLGDGAPLVVVVATVALINLRFLMYSAAVGPRYRGSPLAWRALVAYVLTDQAFAIDAAHGAPRVGRARLHFYLGAALTLVVMWLILTPIATLVAARRPTGLGLELAVPLTFLALLAPTLKSRPAWLAAAVAGAVATAGRSLPYNAGLMLGAVLGALAATLMPAASHALDDGGAY